METGKHFEPNQKKLAALENPDQQWAVALDKCREHIRLRLKRRTTFGAHTTGRLGEDPLNYYISYAYEAILSGDWEWQDEFTLSEQMIRIADSTISTEVEKMGTKKAATEKVTVVQADPDEVFYQQDPVEQEIDTVREIVINKQIAVIEEAITGDNDLEIFWECVKEGMKRKEIAAFMEKTPKQLSKLREKFLKKIKTSPYFEME